MTRFPKTPYCPCHVGSGSLSLPICAHIWCYFSTDLALLTHALFSGILRAIKALSFYTALYLFWRKSQNHQMYNWVFSTFFIVAAEKHCHDHIFHELLCIWRSRRLIHCWIERAVSETLEIHHWWPILAARIKDGYGGWSLSCSEELHVDVVEGGTFRNGRGKEKQAQGIFFWVANKSTSKVVGRAIREDELHWPS